jgi:tRNA/tmRNA/rRNA uracil-C5-methylase (TrmA/RlmC/RlmD family)
MQEEKDLGGCYELKSVIPVDMFPHTPHIECVCLLELR